MAEKSLKSFFSFQRRQKCFCAFCRSERKVYRQRRIGTAQVLFSLIASLVAMALIWSEFDARFLFLFVLGLAVSETFLQLRWRMNIVCPHCGFDPVLYMRKPEFAAKKVMERLEKRKEDPATLFLKPLQIPKKVAKKQSDLEVARESRGHLYSRRG